MGDRALIQFVDERQGVTSPIVYLHWNGTEAPEYIRECAELMKGRDGDAEYACARFIGICHSHISGNTSLGVWSAGDTPITGDASHGDAGCFVVDVHSWDVNASGGYGKSFNARQPAEAA